MYIYIYIYIYIYNIITAPKHSVKPLSKAVAAAKAVSLQYQCQKRE